MQKLTMDRYEPLTMSGPRLHLEDQLRSRVYELLVFLYVLDRIGELRVSRYPSEDRVTDHLQLRELRRIFLDQLAYVCDQIKGGDTIIAKP